MTSLKSHVGQRSDTYHDEITPQRIAQFCRAVGIPESSVAPPTFLTVFRKGEFDLFQKMGIQLARVLHAEQEYQYENPIRSGDCMQFQTTVSNILEKKGSTASMQFITLETLFHVTRDSVQLAVGKSKTTIVIREKNA
jgi:hypothetical protein